MNDVNLLTVVTPLSIYKGCSTWNTFWEVKFAQVNMKIYGCQNIIEHKDVKNSEQYIALDISWKFGNLDKIKITYSEPKYYLERSGKGFITSLDLNNIRRSKEIKKYRFAIYEVILKDISTIIKEFKDLNY